GRRRPPQRSENWSTGECARTWRPWTDSASSRSPSTRRPCATSTSPARPPSTGNLHHMAIDEITVDQLAEVLPTGARLIDVREPHEYDEARVPGALLVPLATVPDQVDMFRGDGPTYVICAAGGRSMR